jgi:erythromycin esterase
MTDHSSQPAAPDESTSERPNQATDEQAAPLDRLAATATALEGTDPSLALGDLAPLDDALADRSVVALGEATHGTREFFQLKHRLLRYLVERQGVRTFAIEANFTETLALDTYVRDGEAPIDAALPEFDALEAEDPAAAGLEGMYFWTWQTEELRALVEWCREFNEGRPLDDQVRFFGFDAQYTAGPAAGLDAYLRTVDADFHDEVAADLDTLDDEPDEGTTEDDGTVDQRLATAADIVETVGGRLDQRREAYVEATSERAWALARRQVRVIEQASGNKRASQEDDVERGVRDRDVAMADNVAWLQEFSRQGRLVVWAHNGHVNRRNIRFEVDDEGEEYCVPSMGSHLADRYGEAYYALGFEFARGGFQAIAKPTDENDVEEAELRAFELDSPVEGTAGETLAELDRDVALFDVEAASGDDVVTDWLATERPINSLGAVYDPAAPEAYVREYVLADAFDALCFVAETSRARPLDGSE